MSEQTNLRVLFAVLAIGMTVLALAIGGCVVWLKGPVEVERSLVFTVRDGSPAKVFVGGVLLGSTPLELEHEDLERLFEPYATPDVWPPAGADAGGKDIVGGYVEEQASADANPNAGRRDHEWYLRESQNGVTETRVLRFRVEAEDGSLLERTGRNSTGTTLIRSHSMHHEFTFN